jgi:SARP family transcriptional regulator, regulator of embCAB operon
VSWKAGSDGETGLNFSVLGPLQLTVEGTPVSLGAPKQRAVLAMLVINRNRPVGVESLINAVWDESPVPAARASIHSYISNLRRLLGNAGIDTHTVLVSAPPGYRLNVADADCDLGRFTVEMTAGFRQGRVARGDRTPGLSQNRA